MFDCCVSGSRDFETAKKLIESIKDNQYKFLDQGFEAFPNKIIPTYHALPLIDQAILEGRLGFFSAAYSPDYDKAIEHEKRALEILEKLPQESEEKLRTISNLAQSYLLRGQVTEGIALIEKGRELLKKSKSDLFNALFIYVESLSLLDQGDFEGIIRVMDKYAYLFERIADYLSMSFYPYKTQSETLIKMRRKEEGVALLEKLSKMVQKFYGQKESTLSQNITVLRALSCLDSNLKAQKKSVNQIKSAIDAYNKLYGSDKKHRNQAFAYFVLGQLYEGLKDFPKAMDAYEKSESIYETVLKEKKIDDVSRLYFAMALLAMKRGVTLKDDERAGQYLRKHNDTFGLGHPRTLEILNYARAHKRNILH